MFSFNFFIFPYSFLYIQFVDSVSFEKDVSLTLSQKQSLEKFRKRVSHLLKDDIQKHDIYLIRWLRARDFNLEAAEAMLKENLRWQQQNQINQILRENFTDMYRDYPATVDTYDKEGRPIVVLDAFDWDIRLAAIQGRGRRLVRYVTYLLENVTQQVFDRQLKGLNVTQWVILGNCESFNVVNHGCPLCIPLWIQVVNILENHYPGWLDELIAIEAPQPLFVVLEIVQPFFSKQTREAIKIFRPNRASKWKEYLSAKISPEERRKEYGGTKM